MSVLILLEELDDVGLDLIVVEVKSIANIRYAIGYLGFKTLFF